MEKKENEGIKTPDAETQKILDEMKEDGIIPPIEETKDDELDEKDEKKEEKSGDDDDDDDEEEKDEDVEENDGEDDEEEEEDGADKETEERTLRHIPLWQHKKELKQQEKRLRTELGKAAKSVAERSDDIDEDSDEVKEIVDEFGLDPEKGPRFVQKLIQAASKRSGNISKAEFDEMKEKLRDSEEDKRFNEDMRKTTKTIRKLFPEVSPGDMEQIKEKIKELAYTKRYAKYSLDDIVTLNRESLSPMKRKKTGEKGRKIGGERGVESYDLENPDSIPWGELSDKEFSRISDELAKKNRKLKIVRQGQQIN